MRKQHFHYIFITFQILITNIIQWSWTQEDANCFGYLFFSKVVWLWQHDSWWHWDCRIGNQSREMHCELPLGKFNFKLNYSSDSLYIGFRSQWLRIFLKTNEIFTKLSDSQGYSAASMFLGQLGICQFTLVNFHIIPDWFPWCLPGG